MNRIKISNIIVTILSLSTILLINLPVDLSAQTEDTTPPELSAFSFIPITVDVSSGPQIVAATLQATDAPAGVNAVYVTIHGPSALSAVTGGSSMPISGDALNGVYEISLSFPQFSETGTWHVTTVRLGDLTGNWINIDESELIAMNYPTEVEVVGESDTTPPELSAFSFIPTTVDVSSGPQIVAATLQATDAPAGVNAVYVTIHGPSALSAVTGGSSMPISGDALNGVYEISLSFPQFSETGTWHVTTVRLGDLTGNWINIGESELIAMNYPTEVEVVGESDTTPPELSAFSFIPTTVDVSSGPQIVAATLQATDAPAGVNAVYVTIHGPSALSAVTGGSSMPISGDALNGVYEISLSFPQFSETGTWHVTTVRLGDLTGNWINIDESELIAMNYPTEVEVVSMSDTDGDGIPDGEDTCPFSYMSETVVIDSCNSGVENVLFNDGCTISDLISQRAADADNHGQFVSSVSRTTKSLKKGGIISGREKGKIQSCAGKADIP